MFKFDEVIECFDADVKEKFLANISESHLALYKSREWSNLHSFIDYAFTWSLTPEGQDYWSSLSKKEQRPFYIEYNGTMIPHDTEMVELSEHSQFAGEIRPESQCFYCLAYNEWFDREETSYQVLNSIGNHAGRLSEAAIDNDFADDYVFIDSQQCYAHEDHTTCADDEDGVSVYILERCNDSVYSSTDDIRFTSRRAANSNGYYFREHMDDYIHEDSEDFYEQATAKENNSGYHSLSRLWATDSNTPFTIGFEVEKEDEDVGSSHHYQRIYDETKWCKESDGSLCDESGYELVSPVYNLYDNKLDIDIEREDLKELINACYNNDTCGGHINLGSTTHTTEELFEGLSQFFPLLYAMYTHRIDESYSKAKKKHEYYQREKYSAVYMRSNVLEFRIFSAVKNTKQLLWRRDLIRLFVENINKSEADVLRMLVDSRSKLYKHLRKVYSQDQLIDKVELYVNYVRTWNNKKLPKPNSENIKKDNLEKGLEDNEAA